MIWRHLLYLPVLTADVLVAVVVVVTATVLVVCFVQFYRNQHCTREWPPKQCNSHAGVFLLLLPCLAPGYA